MAAVMLLMAGASLMAAQSERKAMMEAKVADAKLQRARLEKARLRATSDYQTNSSRAREAAANRDIQIESNRVQAEAALSGAFAGSGISGQSVNELDNQILMEATKNKMQNKTALGTQLGDLSRNYLNTMTDTAAAAKSIDTTPIKSNLIQNIAGAAGAASSVQGFDASVSKKLGF